MIIMNRTLLIGLWTLMSFVVSAQGIITKFPKVYTWDAKLLVEARERALSKDTKLQPAVNEIVDRANKMLTERNVSVTDKSKDAVRIAGGDPHNFVSFSIYFWPDPSDSTKPWIRIDGKANKELEVKFDYTSSSHYYNRITYLTLAWWLTNDTRYAKMAAEQLRVWYLNKDTYMYPQLNKAQFVPNHPKYGNGSCYGVLDAEKLALSLNYVGLLELSGEWSAKDNADLQEWYRQLSKWMMETKNGKEEANQPNNHGVFYDATLSTALLFIGDSIGAKRILTDVKYKRINTQIEPDGSMPRELARAGSYGYTCKNLEGFLRLAYLGDKVNVDLWNYQSSDGRSIKAALEFLIPFIEKKRRWEWRENIQPKGLFESYWQGAQRYPELKEALNNWIIPDLPSERVLKSSLNITFLQN